MKVLVSALLFTLFLSLSGQAQDGSKEAVQKAIAVFRADPLSPEAKEAIPVVMNFVDKSPDVEVRIDSKAVPWFDEEPQPQHAAILLAAYVVGNARVQLESGKARNDSVAGILEAITTYRLLQKQEPDLKMPELEKLIELHAQNKLKEYLNTP